MEIIDLLLAGVKVGGPVASWVMQQIEILNAKGQLTADQVNQIIAAGDASDIAADADYLAAKARITAA